MQQNVTDKLRRQRLSQGLTLRALADKCAAEGVPVHNSQLSKIERGINAPRPELRGVLARLLQVDVMDFKQAGTEAAGRAA